MKIILIVLIICALISSAIDKEKIRALKDENDALKLILEKCHGIVIDGWACPYCGCKEFKKIKIEDGREMLECVDCGELFEG